MNNLLLLHIKFWEYKFYASHRLFLLLLIPVFLFFKYYYFKKKQGTVKFTRQLSEQQKVSYGPINMIVLGIYILIGIGVSFLVFALAKPYLSYSSKHRNDYRKGIDIVISMDISGSMLATDFLPNRLEAAKVMAKEFVDGRESDRIGFVAFEGEAYTVCPATRNYEYLKQTIERVQTGVLEPGTAIGTGLGTAVAQLRSDSLISKVVILLTDGENNRGEISPMTAAHLAKDKNIRVYTIGVGKKGYVEMPINTPFGVFNQKTKVTIDEGLLTRMAELTGGEYFRATDENSLRQIYKTIDKMEKNKIKERVTHREPSYFPQYFLLYGLLFLCLGLLIEQIVLRKYE